MHTHTHTHTERNIDLIISYSSEKMFAIHEMLYASRIIQPVKYYTYNPLSYIQLNRELWVMSQCRNIVWLNFGFFRTSDILHKWKTCQIKVFDARRCTCAADVHLEAMVHRQIGTRTKIIFLIFTVIPLKTDGSRRLLLIFTFVFSELIIEWIV